jgi:hypothetical protein
MLIRWWIISLYGNLQCPDLFLMSVHNAQGLAAIQHPSCSSKFTKVSKKCLQTCWNTGGFHIVQATGFINFVLESWITSYATCQSHILHNKVWETSKKMISNTLVCLTWNTPGLCLDSPGHSWHSRHLDCTGPGLYLECLVVTWTLPGVYQDTWVSVKYWALG